MEHAAPADGVVWYAAYGSNLWRPRFACYLAGGTPPGAHRSHRGHPGCRDTSPPRADRPVAIPHRLYFAGASRSWGGGGVAFLDPEPDPDAGTLGRAWLVAVHQLADVLAQENGRPPPGPHLPVEDLAAGGAVTLGTGPYEHLLGLGVLDGVPLVTFTSARRLAETPPGPRYTETLLAGLAETYGLSPDEAGEYVRARAAPSSPAPPP